MPEQWKPDFTPQYNLPFTSVNSSIQESERKRASCETFPLHSEPEADRGQGDTPHWACLSNYFPFRGFVLSGFRVRLIVMLKSLFSWVWHTSRL